MKFHNVPFTKWKLVLHLLKTVLKSAFLSWLKITCMTTELLFTENIVTLNSTLWNRKSDIYYIL